MRNGRRTGEAPNGENTGVEKSGHFDQLLFYAEKCFILNVRRADGARSGDNSVVLERRQDNT